MSNAAALPVPSLSAISVATAGVCLKCETVETTTPPICSARDPGVGDRLAGRLDGHRGDGLLVGGPVPGRDAGAGADPLVGGVDRLQDHLVGHDPGRPVAADAEDARVRGALAGLDLRHAARGSFQAPAASAAGRAVLGDELAGRVEVVGGLERQGLHAGQRALGETGERAARAHLDDRGRRPSSLNVSMHRSQRTGLATWPTSRASDLGAGARPSARPCSRRT